MESFLRLFESDCSADEAYQILCDLSPRNLSIDQIYRLTLLVENQRNHQGVLPPHVNIFGTGGDCTDDFLGKTLNISSLSAMIASRYTTVVKIGTRGVTARWGSADFYSYIAKKFPGKNYPFQFCYPSRFINLSNLGFSYSEGVLQARRALFEANKLDLFKVIFPYANFTSSYGQVNGVSLPDYLEIFSALASYRPSQRILLIHNEYRHDELFPGKNTLIFHFAGMRRSFDVFVEEMPQSLLVRFHERETLREQVAAAKELLDDPITRERFLEILCLNAATLMCLDHWDEFSDSFLFNKANIIKKEVVERNV